MKLPGSLRLPGAVIGVQLILGSLASAQLTIVRNPIGGTPPANLAGAGDLDVVFNAAADYWELLVPASSHTLTLDYGWAPLPSATLANHQLLAQGGTPSRETHGRIEFDNDGSTPFFADGTPLNHDEYQLFFEDSADLGGCKLNTQRSYQFPLAGSPAAGAVDLFTTALHEIGHALGLASENTSFLIEAIDGQIDVAAPLPFAGTALALAPNSAHLFGLPQALLAAGGAPEVRLLPSDADRLAIAQLSAFPDVVLGSFSASSVVRNGNGVNPPYFSELSPPVVGATWTTSVTQVGQELSAVFVGLGGPTLQATLHGELLVAAPIEVLSVNDVLHSIQIPNDCSLIGASVSAQAYAYFSPIGFSPYLTNAIDIKIGAY